MKKLIITMLFILLLTGCSNNINKITYEELNQKLENKESFILYVGEEENFTKLLKDIKDINIYKLNNLTQEESNNLRLKISYEEPSIIFIKNGVDETIKSHITNINITKEELNNRLKDMGYIKEEK